MEPQNSTRSRPQSKAAEGGGASTHLANLPSRGLFSSTVLSSNLGGLRVYVCDHDTSPPEEQIIKTNTTNILIRALQLSRQKSDLKDASKGGLRVYVCDHDTSPPEEQIIKTNTTNILIRALQLSRQKSDLKDASKVNNKGKRSAGKALEERTPAKRANNAGSSSSGQPEGSTSENALQKMTVERLRDLLKKKDLPIRGKKDELILRLMNGV